MRHKIAPVKNVRALGEAGRALSERPEGLPGMGIVWGPTGAGKTTGAAWFRNRVDGAYVRAYAVWTPAAMLGAIIHELGGVAARSCARTLDDIIDRLGNRPRPLIIDEADYLISSGRMLETLRDLHDATTAPVVLIGMDGIQRAIQGRRQLTGRITQWLHFRPADLDDAHVLRETLSEVGPDDALLARLHGAAKGSVRLITAALSRIEAFGKARGLSEVSADVWGDEPFFFGLPPVVEGG